MLPVDEETEEHENSTITPSEFRPQIFSTSPDEQSEHSDD